MSGNNSSLALQGIIDIELKDRKTGKVKDKRHLINHVTPVGSQMILNASIGDILGYSPTSFGKSGTYFHVGLRYPSDNLANALLNLSTDELTNLTSTSNSIKYFDDNMQTMSKVIGYANTNQENVPADSKQGRVIDTKDEYVLKPNIIGGRWRYDPGYATGTINTIAMAPMASLTHPFGGNGFDFWKLINPDLDYTWTTDSCAKWLPPGVHTADNSVVYTADDEVMFESNNGGFTKWKVNLSTGVVTKVADTEKFATFYTLGITASQNRVYDYYIENNFLYVLYRYDATKVVVKVYDISTSLALVYTSASITPSTSVAHRIYEAKFLKLPNDTKLYISLMTPTFINNVPYMTMSSTTGYYTYVSANTGTWASLGMTASNTPAGLQVRSTTDSYSAAKIVCFGNYYDNKYIMYQLTSYVSPDIKADGTKANEKMVKGNYYIFTDFTDIAGTIEQIGSIGCGSVVSSYDDYYYASNANPLTYSKIDGSYIADYQQSAAFWTTAPLLMRGSVKGFLKFGSDRLLSGINTYASGGRPTAYTRAGSVSNKYDYSLQVSMEGWQGNLFSWRKLETPIVKGEDDELTVSYSYNLVSMTETTNTTTE